MNCRFWDPNCERFWVPGYGINWAIILIACQRSTIIPRNKIWKWSDFPLDPAIWLELARFFRQFFLGAKKLSLVQINDNKPCIWVRPSHKNSTKYRTQQTKKRGEWRILVKPGAIFKTLNLKVWSDLKNILYNFLKIWKFWALQSFV